MEDVRFVDVYVVLWAWECVFVGVIAIDRTRVVKGGTEKNNSRSCTDK